ncbi:hypothetical protein LSAT2_025204 [Lamellibrachia satsuma]|nr:hypothetical protein LSAT2_025204 [Lamellibrachia satsuma]
MKTAVNAIAALLLLFTTMVSTTPITTTERPSPELLACVRQCELTHLECVEASWRVNEFLLPTECYDLTKKCLQLCHQQN